MNLPPIYDPRHTTGVSPVPAEVKHPLANDPRRGASGYQLHQSVLRDRGLNGTSSRKRTLLGLFAFLAFLLVMLAGAILFVLNAAAD